MLLILEFVIVGTAEGAALAKEEIAPVESALLSLKVLLVIVSKPVGVKRACPDKDKGQEEDEEPPQRKGGFHFYRARGERSARLQPLKNRARCKCFKTFTNPAMKLPFGSENSQGDSAEEESMFRRRT